MIIGSWNIRGLNEPYKQDEVRSWVRVNRIFLFGLNETRVRPSSGSRITRSLMRGWKSINNYNHHSNGRIWILWDPSVVDIDMIYSTSQVIHVTVLLIQKQISFQVSFIYGLNSYTERLPLWRCIRQTARVMDSPWMLIGDFNAVRYPSE